MSQKSFRGSSSQTVFFGGDKRQPEIGLRSQANQMPAFKQTDRHSDFPQFILAMCFKAELLT